MSTRYFLCKELCFLERVEVYYSFLKGELFKLVEKDNIYYLLPFKSYITYTFYEYYDFYLFVENGYFEELSEDEVRIKDIIE